MDDQEKGVFDDMIWHDMQLFIIRNDWNCINETSFTSSKARPTASTIQTTTTKQPTTNRESLISFYTYGDI